MEDIPPPLPVQSRLPPPKPAAHTASGTAKGFAKFLAYGVAGIFFALCIALATPRLPAIPGPAWVQWIPFATMPFVWFLAVGVHELGHLVGGWMRGARFMLLAVGPMMWRQTPTGVRFMRNRSHNIGGGMVICLPDDPAKVTTRDTALMFAGGPLASLALALVAFLLLRAIGLPQGAGANRAIVMSVLFYLGLVSFLLFFFNAIPTSEKGLRTDGARFLALMRGGIQAEQEKATLMISISYLAGHRPSTLSPVIVRQATALQDASLSDLYAHAALFHHALDTGNAVRAQALLDYVVSHEAKLTVPVREGMRCEYAWLLATHTGDAAAARAWLDSAGKLEWDPATRLRCEAAVLLAEGKAAAAATTARAALAALQQRSISPVQNPYSLELIQQLLTRADAPA